MTTFPGCVQRDVFSFMPVISSICLASFETTSWQLPQIGGDMTSATRPQGHKPLRTIQRAVTKGGTVGTVRCAALRSRPRHPRHPDGCAVLLLGRVL